MKKTIFLLLLGLSCTPAYAYIGPGIGTGVIASVLGVLSSLILLVIGLIYYPIKRMLKKRKQSSKKTKEQ